MNILKKANEIINERSEEKQRQYGDMDSSMKIAQEIFQSMRGKYISIEDIYYVIIAVKLSRERFQHKEDNLLDTVAYMGAMNDYIESNKKTKQQRS